MPEEIWPELERLFLAHGWQGRLYGLQRWLKAGLERRMPAGEMNVIAVRDAGKDCDALSFLDDKSCGTILIERADSSAGLPQANPYADVHLLLDAETPILTARNIGAGLSAGKILVFIAGDARPQAGFLQAYEKVFEDFPQTLACRGQILCPYLEEAQAVTGSFRLPDNIDLWPVDLEENMAIRADKFFYHGGFDESMLPGYGALDLSIRVFGEHPDFKLQRYAPFAKLVWDDSDSEGLPFAEYLSLRQRSWLELNETMKTYLGLYAQFWQQNAAKELGEIANG